MIETEQQWRFVLFSQLYINQSVACGRLINEIGTKEKPFN